jgi:hypothetical protein
MDTGFDVVKVNEFGVKDEDGSEAEVPANGVKET